MPSKFQSVVLRPLTGIFDGRSAIDELPAGAFRWKENASISPDGKLGRALGFTRFYKRGDCLTNHDLHDQGVAIGEREPVTGFFASVANDGVRRLFAMTKSKLRLVDEAAGTWTLLGSGFGADSSAVLTQLRFRAAELQNRVLFTNNFDPVQIHELGTGTVAPVADLANVEGDETGENDDDSGLTKSKVIVSWNGFIFLMNNVEGGVRYASRIRWCDLNKPEVWQVGGAGNYADFQDLPYGERILAAIPLQGSLFVLTDSAIWRCNLAVDSVTPAIALNCNRVYSEPKNKAKCLAFPNTVVSDGLAIWYLGADGLYRFVPGQSAEPERVEWAHRATGIVFRDAATRIDKLACESPVLEFRPATNENDSAGLGELHLSWPVYDPPAEEADPEIDCDAPAKTPTPGTGLNRHSLVVNTKFTTADYRDYGMAAYVNFRSDAGGAGDCNQQVIFIGASATDYTLKTMDVGSLREMYDPEGDSYSDVGYFTRLVSVFPFDKPDLEKEIQSFTVEHDPADEADPAVFRLRIGTADQSLDPMLEGNGCRVLWRQLSDQTLRCRYTKSAAAYQAANVKPRNPVSWSFFYSGRFLYVDLTIAAADGTAPKTGLCTMSRFEVEARVI